MIADGTTLKIYGMQALKFSIHNRQFQHKMVVADLTVDGILGLDFLKSNDCTLNIANCSLILTKPESHIPCHYKGTLGCYRITLSENLTLPPLSEMLTFCNLTKTDTKCKTQSIGIVEPCKQFEGSDRALVARAFFYE